MAGKNNHLGFTHPSAPAIGCRRQEPRAGQPRSLPARPRHPRVPAGTRGRPQMNRLFRIQYRQIITPPICRGGRPGRSAPRALVSRIRIRFPRRAGFCFFLISLRTPCALQFLPPGRLRSSLCHFFLSVLLVSSPFFQFLQFLCANLKKIKKRFEHPLPVPVPCFLFLRSIHITSQIFYMPVFLCRSFASPFFFP